jgi:hypothetical protein
MKRLLIVVLCLCCAVAVHASQGAGHVYVALKAFEQCPQAVRDIITSNPNAYLAGATGPDIALTTWLIAEAFGWHHPGTEAHYEKTGQLIVNMARIAATYPEGAQRNQALAFTLGWLTHYCTDCVIHPLVNECGGYFSAGSEFQVRHKQLEVVECAHVYEKKYGDLDAHYSISSLAVPIDLIRAAFYATYPDKVVYSPELNAMQGAGSFVADLAKSSLLMAQATSWLVSAYRGQWNPARGPVFSTVLKGYTPTPDEYKALMEPLRIDSVTMEPPDRDAGETEGKLKVTYTVNDLKLYKLFCKQWDSRIGRAVSNAVAFFNAYAANPAGFQVPDRNLDTGGAQGSTFDAATAWPGNPDIYQVLAFAEITNPDKQEVSRLDKTGQWYPIPFTTPGVGGDLIGTVTEGKGWNSGVTGTAFLKIPFDATKAGDYHAKIRLAFANKADKRLYGWPEQGQTIEANWEGDLLGGKPELSILFLVDTSGSMDGSKIAAARAAVKSSVDQTNDGKTEWCLVRFGGCSVKVICRFTMDPAKLKAAADLLSAGGDTPLVYGREKALEYLTLRGQGTQGRMVILCDGQNNCSEHGGITQPEASAQLQKLMQEVQSMPLGGGR